jgi:lipoyl-dependent peroxiredoxin
MASLERKAEATWTGDLKGGKGEISASSGAIAPTAYGFGTRFEQAPGTNPEELLAAAHAACYSMAFAAGLGRNGHSPEEVHTLATAYLTPQEGGGFKITKVRLEARAKVEGVDQAELQRLAEDAEKNICIISKALSDKIEIELDAQLA